MSVLGALSDRIDSKVPSRAKKPVQRADQPVNSYALKPGVAPERSKDPKIQAEIAKRMAAQRRK